jgi:hypothetical protein
MDEFGSWRTNQNGGMVWVWVPVRIAWREL